MKCSELDHCYFCGNCEDELRGYPLGYRIPDRRPLCDRCTQEGETAGTASRIAYPYKSDLKGATLIAFLAAIVMYFLVTFARS